MHTGKRCARALGLATSAVLGLICSNAAVEAAAFSSGSNLVVVRLGDGTAPLGSGSAAAFLDEYQISGTTATKINTVTIPASGANALTMSAIGNHDGLLRLSSNGEFLTIAGYRVDAGFATDPAGSTATAIPRVIGRIAADGSVNTSTTITDAYDNFAIRGAASTDGSHFWTSGDGNTGSAGHDGLRYVSGLGGSTSVDLGIKKPDNTDPPYVNSRSVSIFGGALYATSGSSTSIGKAAFKVAGGLPTGGPNTLTTLTTDNISVNEIFLADLDGSVPGYDTLYTTTGNLQKYSLVGGAWVAKGTAALGGLETLAASVNGNAVTIYAATATGVSVITDTTGYNNTLGASFTSLITAPANEQFRGLAPVPEPATAGMIAVAAFGLLVHRRRGTR